MRVVSNTSPIWNLTSIQRLDLLREQFAAILIPPEVLSELRSGNSMLENAAIQEAIDAGWIEVLSLKTPELKQSLLLELDQGEAAAIALALEQRISKILIDETEGRIKAKALGLFPTGVLGILLRAKYEGRIESVRDEMQKLRHDAGFFIAEPLFQRILVEAGEET
ncbi:hypothetical protein U14_04564 [Candidatus Moduliflexus flocculans]|uniref:DUF3368 domain-containing protein n=1 Tax=Candidatus Moduliflexus flocculans TaxID=1499966 RepID=A0A0S6W5A6_9BACT|nr:hypothetical protein U14_04564 [Candidatus Moduliflexus flocculans]